MGVFNYSAFYIMYILTFIQLALQFKADLKANDWEKYVVKEEQDDGEQPTKVEVLKSRKSLIGISFRTMMNYSQFFRKQQLLKRLSKQICNVSFENVYQVG